MYLKDLKTKSEEGEYWESRTEFVLACLGYTVGFGNVLIFPNTCLKNGGVSFLIMYTVMLFILGFPICFLEMFIGQFTSSGPATCWKFARIFKGIGVAMFLMSMFVAIYYNMYVGWSAYYLYASLTAALPWKTCDPEWSSQFCWTNLPVYNKSHCSQLGLHLQQNGTCYSSGGKLVALYSESLARFYNIKKDLPSKEYLYKQVLGKDFSTGISDLGPMRCRLVFCYLFAWMCVAVKLSNPWNQFAKNSLLVILFPYIILLMLLGRSLLLPGHYIGINFFMQTDYSALRNVEAWIEASIHIFFTLSLCLGGLISLARRNKFTNDSVRDTFIVVSVNYFTSIGSAIMLFSFGGYISKLMDIPIEDVLSTDSMFVFDMYPYVLTKLPLPVFWSIMSFLMLIMFGLNSQFVLVDTCLQCIMDVFPNTRNKKLVVVPSLCGVLFLLGLPLTTNGGIYLMDMMHRYGGGWCLMAVSIVECLAIVYVYGMERLMLDIESMLGNQVCFCLPEFILNMCCISSWGIVGPLISSVFIGYTVFNYKQYRSSVEMFDLFGWLMLSSIMLAIFVTAVIVFYYSGRTFKERIYKSTIPSSDWGPALIENRKLVALYNPNFVIEPEIELVLRQTGDEVELGQRPTEQSRAKQLQHISL
ncbi:sodium-dependent proline transporter-like isoform X2 [Gigantopelta aegis]|uniref:sodium-dependent proline transporter-like isoform X2 n=1 Tax=Gigantopelta aegis TaxID=1735272 RepID=UPI001B88A6AB|nr:sodium-dependent proline transporter-like isoform X2 [Gigantopelta aegis]